MKITDLTKLESDLRRDAREQQDYTLSRTFHVGNSFVTAKVTNGNGRMRNGMMVVYYLNGKRSSWKAVVAVVKASEVQA